MLYRYKFVDETKFETDVDGETFRMLRQLDRQARYNNAKNKAVAFNDEEYGKSKDMWEEVVKMKREERNFYSLILKSTGLRIRKSSC